MKKLLGVDIEGQVVFNPTLKTITFSNLNLATAISLRNILLINNATTNDLIYNFADTFNGAVSFTNNVLTLDNPCLGMASTDVLQVWLDTEDYQTVTVDQTQPTVIGGVAPSGARLRAKVGSDGGLQFTDAPQPQVGVAQAVNQSPTGWIDTTGYQSIVVTFATVGSLTVQFQSTNDPQYPVSGGNALGWPTLGIAVPLSSLTNPTAGQTYVFPTTGKFFRVIISSYTSGVLTTVTQLRAAPAVFVPSNSSISIQQIAGAAISGLGSAANTPLSVGGSDTGGLTRRNLLDTNGNQQIVGSLPVGWQYGQFNQTFGRATQTLTSQTAAQSTAPPVTVGGLDGASASRPILLDTIGAQAITSAPSTQANQSIQELLYQMLATLRVIALYQYQISQGLTPNAATDEPDTLLADFMNPASSFSNMAN